MEKTTVTLINPLGLHARPAALLTSLTKGFKSDIVCYKNGIENKRYQPKSILSVMAMTAKQGDQLIFEANGEDEKEAIRAIEEFINSGCGE